MKKLLTQMSTLWRGLWPLGVATLAVCLLSACAQLTPPPSTPVFTPTPAVPAGDTGGDTGGDTLGGMGADTLLTTVGPSDGTKPAGTSSGRGLYAGIGFVLPPAPAQAASGEVIAAVNGGPDAPWWEPAPKHPEIKLVGYPVDGSVQAARIVVYPVAELAAANPEAAKRIEALQQLLAQPAPAGGENGTTSLPFLPLTNAGSALAAQVKRLSFDGGQGVRYLAQLGQGPAPINNQELFYTFQGLTDDGAHYVAAILPITHASLPATADSVPPTADFAQYLAGTTGALDAQPDASFQPGLAELDSLVQSLSVTP